MVTMQPSHLVNLFQEGLNITENSHPSFIIPTVAQSVLCLATEWKTGRTGFNRRQGFFL
jgi:hypothetical protein